MLKDALREKSDIFNSENPEEDKVCLLNQWLFGNKSYAVAESI
jgi:hypothetical protein